MEKITLPNGLRVILLPVPDVRSASFGVWVMSGSRFENPQNNGVSHFIEHMVFKGTHTRTAFDIARQTDQMGGQINAFTTKECTCFYGKILDEHLPAALGMVSDMLTNPLFDKKDMDTERGVILEEIGMYEDSPEDLVSDLLHMGIYPDNMLRENIAGTRQTVTNMTCDDLFAYMGQSYTPARTVLAVGGSFDKAQVLKLAEQLLNGGKKEGQTLTPLKAPVYTPALELAQKDFEQTSLLFGLPTFGADNDRRFALSVINSVLGGSQTSRMNQKIREELGLAYSAYSYANAYLGTGLLSMALQVNPENEGEAILQTVDILNNFTNSISKEEVDETCEKIKINTVLGFESISSRVGFLGRNELMLGQMKSPDDLIDEINAVTFEQVRDLCEEIFDMSKLSFSAVGKIRDTAFYRGMIGL